MAVKRPTTSQLRAVATDLGMTLSDSDTESFLGLMTNMCAAYDALDAMPDYLPPVKYFDATGHPAMSLPCGQSDGLPIGLMLIGKQWEESTIYRVARAFEQAGDWRER